VGRPRRSAGSPTGPGPCDRALPPQERPARAFPLAAARPKPKLGPRRRSARAGARRALAAPGPEQRRGPRPPLPDLRAAAPFRHHNPTAPPRASRRPPPRRRPGRPKPRPIRGPRFLRRPPARGGNGMPNPPGPGCRACASALAPRQSPAPPGPRAALAAHPPPGFAPRRSALHLAPPRPSRVRFRRAATHAAAPSSPRPARPLTGP
jgi:hypothetical protein